MEEIRVFMKKAEKMPKAQLIKELPNILKKAKAIGFLKVAKEIPEISDLIRSKMAQFEVDEALALMKQFIPVVFDALKELIKVNEDIKEEIEDTEDTSVAMVLDDADFAMTFIVKDGQFDFKLEAVADADLTLRMTKDTMKKFMSGELDPVQGYMSGEVVAQGNLTKAMALRSIFEMLGDEFGVRLMG